MNPLPENSRAREVLDGIRGEIPLLGLGPGQTGSTDWPAELAGISDEELLGDRIVDPTMASAVRSGLILRADLLDDSHRVSQAIDTPTGSYWHGIMHRREGDFGNSKYWFNRVGSHPLFPDLARRTGDIESDEIREVSAGGRWDPFLFVDLCESRYSTPRDSLTDALEALQELEIELLLGFSCAKALGR